MGHGQLGKKKRKFSAQSMLDVISRITPDSINQLGASHANDRLIDAHFKSVLLWRKE